MQKVKIQPVIFKGILIALLIMMLGIVGFMPLVMPFGGIISLILFIILFLLFTAKIHWGYIFLILFLPITNLRFSIYSPDVNLFNVYYLYHIIIFIMLISYFLNKLIKKSNTNYIENNQHDSLGIMLIFFAFWALIAIFWAPDLAFSLLKYSQLILCLFAYFLFIKLLNNRNHLQRGINVWIITGVISSFAIILSLLLKENIYEVIKEFGEGLFYIYYYIGYYTPLRGSGFADPKYISNFLNFAILFSLGNLVEAKRFKTKIIILFSTIFMFFSHLLTQSRGALGGLLISITFILIVIRPWRKKLIASMSFYGFSFLILFLLFLSAQVINKEYHEVEQGGTGSRITSVAQSTEGMEIRIKIWKSLFKKFSHHNAYINGLGAGASSYYMSPLPHAHGFFLSILYDLGFIGFAIFLSMVVILIKDFFKVLKSNDSYYRTMLCAFYAGLIAFSINGLIEFEYFLPIIWAYLGVGMAMMRLFREEKATPGRMKE